MTFFPDPYALVAPQLDKDLRGNAQGSQGSIEIHRERSGHMYVPRRFSRLKPALILILLRHRGCPHSFRSADGFVRLFF
jgi:hypothetical protein